jgi:hypothetical protein
VPSFLQAVIWLAGGCKPERAVMSGSLSLSQLLIRADDACELPNMGKR